MSIKTHITRAITDAATLLSLSVVLHTHVSAADTYSVAENTRTVKEATDKAIAPSLAIDTTTSKIEGNSAWKKESSDKLRAHMELYTESLTNFIDVTEKNTAAQWALSPRLLKMRTGRSIGISSCEEYLEAVKKTHGKFEKMYAERLAEIEAATGANIEILKPKLKEHLQKLQQETTTLKTETELIKQHTQRTEENNRLYSDESASPNEKLRLQREKENRESFAQLFAVYRIEGIANQFMIENKRTLLHYAVLNDDVPPSFITELLEEGADTTQEDTYGNSPISYATALTPSKLALLKSAKYSFLLDHRPQGLPSTYYMSPQVEASKYKSIIQKSLQSWRNVIRVETLNFTQVNNEDEANIKFVIVNHYSDNNKYAETDLNKGPVLNSVITLFDDNMHDRSDVDNQCTIAHEIGHALGLGHTMNRETLMYPYSITRNTLEQTAAEIAGIHKLYNIKP